MRMTELLAIFVSLSGSLSVYAASELDPSVQRLSSTFPCVNRIGARAEIRFSFNNNGGINYDADFSRSVQSYGPSFSYQPDSKDGFWTNVGPISVDASGTDLTQEYENEIAAYEDVLKKDGFKGRHVAKIYGYNPVTRQVSSKEVIHDVEIDTKNGLLTFKNYETRLIHSYRCDFSLMRTQPPRFPELSLIKRLVPEFSETINTTPGLKMVGATGCDPRSGSISLTGNWTYCLRVSLDSPAAYEAFIRRYPPGSRYKNVFVTAIVFTPRAERVR